MSLAPYEHICKCWTSEPHRFGIDPMHHMPGVNTSVNWGSSGFVTPANAAKLLRSCRI